jgi:cytochrome c
MKSIVIAAVVAIGMTAAGTASAQEALAKSSGCLTCHDIATKKMGPAFKDVAAKFKGKADAEATLVAKVSGAKDHPKVTASEGDVKNVVKWVLSL